jgi:hypothetical protein
MAIDYEKLFNKSEIDFESLKNLKIDIGIKEPSRGREDNFIDHIKMLEKEFDQQTLLEFYAVWIIVKIRRKLDLNNTLEQFFKLWNTQATFLIKHLSARWLISVCDTFIDYSKESNEVAYAFSTLFFMNTIKLYETEKAMYNQQNPQYYPEFLTAKVQLFDGITAYNAKGGDMVKNMFNRLNNKINNQIVTAQIFKELVDRSNQEDTVYRRMSIHQQNPKHRW